MAQIKKSINSIILITSCVLASVIINSSRFSGPFLIAVIHVIFFVIIVISLILIFRTNFLVRTIIAFVVSIEFFSRLAYGASLSSSAILSVLMSPKAEIFDFILFNYNQVFICLFVYLILSFLSLPKIDKKIVFSFSFMSIIYLLLPTILAETKTSDDFISRYAKYREISVTTARIEFFMREVSWRFWPIKSVIGMVNASDLLSNINEQQPTTWTNVKIVGDKSPKILVIAIGESLRYKNMSLYGYDKNTTPNLLKKEGRGVIAYQNAYSAGVNTVTSVPVSLTKGVNGAPDFSKSIIQLAKLAGYTTHWYSNHAKANNWDFYATKIAYQADDVFFNPEEPEKTFSGKKYDTDILHKLRESLASVDTTEKHLFVVHFYGSHMEFKNRYPKEFSKFHSDSNILDEYDNSVLYTDNYISELFELVGSYGGETVFFSDHGLGKPGGVMAFKHDIRIPPNLDSIHVPLLLTRDEPLKGTKIESLISLYYFECFFSSWTGITAKELVENNYCDNALVNDVVTFANANFELKTLHEKYLIE